MDVLTRHQNSNSECPTQQEIFLLLLEYQMANLKRRLYPLYDKCPVDRPKDAEAEF